VSTRLADPGRAPRRWRAGLNRLCVILALAWFVWAGVYKSLWIVAAISARDRHDLLTQPGFRKAPERDQISILSVVYPKFKTAGIDAQRVFLLVLQDPELSSLEAAKRVFRMMLPETVTTDELYETFKNRLERYEPDAVVIAQQVANRYGKLGRKLTYQEFASFYLSMHPGLFTFSDFPEPKIKETLQRLDATLGGPPALPTVPSPMGPDPSHAALVEPPEVHLSALEIITLPQPFQRWFWWRVWRVFRSRRGLAVSIGLPLLVYGGLLILSFAVTWVMAGFVDSSSRR